MNYTYLTRGDNLSIAGVLQKLLNRAWRDSAMSGDGPEKS